MDLNYILIWMVVISAVIVMMRMLRVGIARTKDWFFLSLTILVVTSTLIFISPNIAGYVGGILWILFFILPMLCMRLFNRSIMQQQFSKALLMAKIMVLLHPSREMRSIPQIVHALKLSKNGKWNEAMKHLEKYQGHASRMERMATTYLYRMNHHWEEFVTWVRMTLPEELLVQDVSMLILMVRALGETGQLKAMLEFYEKYKKHIENAGGVNQALCLLFIFSFCGRRAPVELLFKGILSPYAKSVKVFWLATIDMAQGKEQQAKEAFQTIVDDPDLSVRKGVERRFQRGLASPDLVLDNINLEELNQFENDLNLQHQYGDSVSHAAVRPTVTYVLMGLIGFYFILEMIFGGSTNPYTLFFLGALIPQAVIEGQWWRVIAANFVHFGWLHLAMNLFALLILGPYVEYALGKLRYVICYLLSGILGMLSVVVMVSTGLMEPHMMAGASGSIMGLVGATAAILLRGWKKRKSQAAYKRLGLIGLIIGFQVIFDLSTPQVSFSVHTSGLIFGFLMGSFMHHGFRSQ